MSNPRHLAADLQEVRDYFSRRQIKNYAVVLTAIDPCIEGRMSRLRQIWAGPDKKGGKKASERDADLIARCCKVVEVLKDNAGV